MNGKVLCGCAAIALLAAVGCSTTAEATVAEGGEPVAAVEAEKETPAFTRDELLKLN